MKPSIRALFAALLWAWPALAAAAGAGTGDGLPDRLPEAVAAARVVRVIDGDTVVLGTGAQVRLTGIQAPKLALGRPGFRAWPLAAEARDALAALCLDRRVTLAYGGRRTDRWRRLLAQVRTADAWLQEEMLERGLARVYTFPDNAGEAQALYAAERAARAAKRGIWAHPWYRILAPEEAERAIGTFQLVEGVPVAAATVRGRGYVNFGRDWRRDFTVSIAPPAMKLFRKAGIDPKSLVGRRIRVRGWLVRENGAMIRATHPQQMEVLDR